MIGAEAPAEERRRDRVLSPAELVAVWHACEGRGEFSTIVRLLMLTGASREEVAGFALVGTGYRPGPVDPAGCPIEERSRA